MDRSFNSFEFDIALSLDADSDLFYLLSELKNQNPTSRILSVTFDHRFFNVREKNYIKGLIDHFDLNHLMFTLRPSANSILRTNDAVNLFDFQKLSQLVFTLQCLSRYDIRTAYISNYILSNRFDLEYEATSIFDETILRLDELIAKLPNKVKNSSIEKVFCSLTSLRLLRNQLEGKKCIISEKYLLDSGNEKTDFFDYEPQISELEKNLYWVGFDPKYKEVPWDKKYPETRWNKMVKDSEWGHALYENELRYCNRCCLPETMEGITFDEFGICTPCRSSEEKMHINWEERDLELRSILDSHRSDNYYDCMLPMSGGKDSTFQAYILHHRFDINPLAVTHGANWMSLTGRYNLENCLQQFDLDHIMFHANRSVINKSARKSLSAIGDACWHCHVGSGTFTIQSGYYWNVGLMIWGESIAERDGRGSYAQRKEANVYYNLEVSARVKAEDFSDNKIPYNDLSHWFYPSRDIISRSHLRYLHLGDYMFWDEERHVDFIVEHFEWRDSQVENTYKGYKSTECVMAGVHDYANFIKRGVGRSTVHASDDVRRGLITREEGMELSKEFDSQRPHALDFYLSITGYSEEEFEKILVEARSISKDASKLKRT
ncbi:MAG TPA: N-acetyl sugar amidotransferase [Oligoflexia bacterium]|nr:N-acetyl sugar amidotransferase [Oligoflexia bacterium]HMP48507.1 N-acetyl sugar amidotransferase [Oligoflexia bacterium]